MVLLELYSDGHGGLRRRGALYEYGLYLHGGGEEIKDIKSNGSTQMEEGEEIKPRRIASDA